MTFDIFALFFSVRFPEFPGIPWSPWSHRDDKTNKINATGELNQKSSTDEKK